ncbi:MAG: hypothetical protein HY548_06405 [Elusimicrobia bacterium]|nr:hypothetical protein [Elusimicrobiota bacterium]
MTQDLAVLHVQTGGAPRAFVFTDAHPRPLTPAEAKRTRYVQNLRENYRRFQEALADVERFAVVCELSQERINAIRKAKDEALAELARKFEAKLKAYDARIGGFL